MAELTVPGGTTAILDGYITRDRGANEGTDHGSGSASFRTSW
ncbi:hypothetical protein ACFY3N_34795 [Streptomyces sp. NPDC000348]